MLQIAASTLLQPMQLPFPIMLYIWKIIFIKLRKCGFYEHNLNNQQVNLKNHLKLAINKYYMSIMIS